MDGSNRVRGLRQRVLRRSTPIALLLVLCAAVALQALLIAVGTEGHATRTWGGSTRDNRTFVDGTLNVVPGGTLLIDKRGDVRCSFWYLDSANSTRSTCDDDSMPWEQGVRVYFLTESQRDAWTNRSAPPPSSFFQTTAAALWNDEVRLHVPKDAGTSIEVVFELPQIVDAQVPYPRVHEEGGGLNIDFAMPMLCDAQPAYCFHPGEGDYVAYRRGFEPVLAATEILLWFLATLALLVAVAHGIARHVDGQGATVSRAADGFTSPIEAYLRRLHGILAISGVFWLFSLALVSLAAAVFVSLLQTSGHGWRHLPWQIFALGFAAVGPLLWSAQVSLATELRRWARVMDSPPIGP